MLVLFQPSLYIIVKETRAEKVTHIGLNKY